MQLHALEILKDGLPTWLDLQALTAYVGIAVAGTEVLVKVAQKDCAASSRSGV